MGEFEKISTEGLFDMTRDKLNLIRSLVDETQRLTTNIVWCRIEEIGWKVAQIKLLIKELESRYKQSSDKEEGE